MDDARRRPTTRHAECVGKPSLPPPSTPPLPASNSLSADQLSLGHPHLVEARFVEMITDSRNWRRNLNNSNSSFGPPHPPTTLLSSHFPVPSPLFSEISSSFWLLRRRQHRDELSPETSVFVQLAQSSPASPYLSLSTETVHRR